MKITIHGHRPLCFRSATEIPAQTTLPTATTPPPHVQKINMGFFKIKIHRQTALQASLINVLTPPTTEQVSPWGAAASIAGYLARGGGNALRFDPPQLTPTPVARTWDELRAHWSEWALSANSNEENRQEALRRLTYWLVHNDRREEPLTLDLSSLGLTDVPELPDGLATVDLNGNCLSRLPSNFPASLESLFAVANQLEHPPENLPRGLIELDLSFNLISAFPENLPPRIQRLELGYNRLITLPQTIPQLCNQTSYIDLEGNPLTEQEFVRLRGLTTAPDYQGPQIFFSILPELPYGVAPDRRLDEAVLAWPQQPGVDSVTKARVWQSFATEPNAAAFTQFLDRLRGTINFGNPQFQRSVSDWLTQLEDHPDLRSDTFAVSDGAAISCEDRISLTFNTMRKLHLSSAVARGDYDQQLPELLGLARGMFRLDQLEVIAREKSASLNFVDEIEVYLAYQVKLRENLDLPLDAPDMRFFNMSFVSQQDLDQAVIRVKEAEVTGFADYLASSWQPWQAVLERLDPERHAQARKRLLEALENQFDTRLQAQLQELGLHNDADAQRLVGPKIKDDIAREIQGATTREFLERRGLLSQLSPH